MRKLLFLALLALFASASLHAGDLTSTILRNACAGEKGSADRGFCYGYLLGTWQLTDVVLAEIGGGCTDADAETLRLAYLAGTTKVPKLLIKEPALAVTGAFIIEGICAAGKVNPHEPMQ